MIPLPLLPLHKAKRQPPPTKGQTLVAVIICVIITALYLWGALGFPGAAK